MEAQQIQNQVNARLQLRAEHGHSPKTHSTGSPCPGKLVDGLVGRFPRRGGCGDKPGPPAEGAIQKLDVLRARPFCGPYTAAAPRGPVNGLSTSLATMSRVLASRGSRPLRST